MAPNIGVNLRVTGHCNQGGRKYMEDVFVVAYQQTEDEKDLEYAYFGIFDGHGGREAAVFAKEHLMDHIVSQKNFWSEDDDLVLKAIRDGFITTHLAMWKEVGKWPKTVSGLPSTSGTTSSIVFIRRGKLYLGHVGDSRIILGYQSPGFRSWLPLSLTKDHKPESPKEKKRIYSVGGLVMNKGGVERVVWNRPRIGHKGPIRRSTPFDQIPFLAVARSLGDLWSYNYLEREFVVSPEPDVSVFTLDARRDRCIILGTDGLWNMVSTRDAVNIVQDAEEENERVILEGGGPSGVGKPSNNPSKSLVDKALQQWYNLSMRADNTSVVTVMLDPAGPPKSEVLLRQKIRQKLRPREEQLEVEIPLQNDPGGSHHQGKGSKSEEGGSSKISDNTALSPKNKKKHVTNAVPWMPNLPKLVVLFPHRVSASREPALVEMKNPSTSQTTAMQENLPEKSENYPLMPLKSAQSNRIYPRDPLRTCLESEVTKANSDKSTPFESKSPQVEGNTPNSTTEVKGPSTSQSSALKEKSVDTIFGSSPFSKDSHQPLKSSLSHKICLREPLRTYLESMAKANGDKCSLAIAKSEQEASVSPVKENDQNGVETLGRTSAPSDEEIVSTQQSREQVRTHLSEVDNIVKSDNFDGRVSDPLKSDGKKAEAVADDAVVSSRGKSLKRKNEGDVDSDLVSKSLRLRTNSWSRDALSSCHLAASRDSRLGHNTRYKKKERKVKVR